MKNNFLIAISFLWMTGCYTIIDHPDVVVRNEGDKHGMQSKIYFYDDCAGCHDAQQLDDVHYTIYRPEAQPESQMRMATTYDSGYDYYYNSPWWHEIAPPPAPAKSSAKGNDQSNLRDQSGRTSYQDTDRSRGFNLPLPSQSATSGSHSAGASTGQSGSGSSSDDRKADRPSTRENDGNRKENSGRR